MHNRIWFIEGDCFEVLRKRLKGIVKEGAVLFGSPPWGGPGYKGDEVFDVGAMQPYGLGELVRCRPEGGRLVLFLPRSTDLRQVAREWVGVREREGKGEGKVKVTHYCMWGASKVWYSWRFYGRGEADGGRLFASSLETLTFRAWSSEVWEGQSWPSPSSNVQHLTNPKPWPFDILWSRHE